MKMGSPNVLAGSPASGSQARGLILKMAAVDGAARGAHCLAGRALERADRTGVGFTREAPNPSRGPGPCSTFDSPEGPGPQM